MLVNISLNQFLHYSGLPVYPLASFFITTACQFIPLSISANPVYVSLSLNQFLHYSGLTDYHLSSITITRACQFTLSLVSLKLVHSFVIFLNYFIRNLSCQFIAQSTSNLTARQCQLISFFLFFYD